VSQIFRSPHLDTRPLAIYMAHANLSASPPPSSTQNIPLQTSSLSATASLQSFIPHHALLADDDASSLGRNGVLRSTLNAEGGSWYRFTDGCITGERNTVTWKARAETWARGRRRGRYRTGGTMQEVFTLLCWSSASAAITEGNNAKHCAKVQRDHIVFPSSSR
jgi:hypothetical protein